MALIVAVAGYLHFIGLPQWSIRKLEGVLADHNLYASIGNVKLDFYYGIDAEQVVLYKTIQRKTRLLSADSIAAHLSVKELLIGRRRLTRIHVRNARAMQAMLPLDLRGIGPIPIVKSLDGWWRAGKWQIEHSEINWGRLVIYAVGDYLYEQNRAGRPADHEPQSVPREMLLVGQWLHQSLRLKDAAELALDFSLNTISPERSTAHVVFDGGRALVRDVVYTDINFECSLSPERLLLHSLEFKNGTDSLHLSGTLGLKDVPSSLVLRNTLHVRDLVGMYSPNLAQRLSEEGIAVPAGCKLSLKSGAGEWVNRKAFSGTLSAPAFALRGVPFEKFESSFQYSDGFFEVNGVRAQVPSALVGANDSRQVHGGEVSAAGQFDSKSKEYRLQMTLGFDPWLLLPLAMNSPLESVVREHEFYDEVSMAISVKGTIGDPASHSVIGRVVSGPASRRGASVDSAMVEFKYKDSLLELSPIHAEKEGHSADGKVLINFRTQIIDLDVRGGLDPNSMAQMIHPVVETPVSKFAFNGDNEVHCRGSVDYGTWEKTRMTGTYRGTLIRAPIAEVEEATFDFGMTGDQLYFTNITAKIYGGTCAGNSSFTVSGAVLPYRAEVVASEVGVTELARFFGELDPTVNLGALTGRVSLQGKLSQPVGQNIRGSGSAVLTDGWLVELPALKSLTKLARMVFSSFSTFSQTDCSLDFDLHDGAIYTDNFLLAGDVMTLSGEGRYDFKSGFDAEVEMKPFRKNMLTRVVQWATIPFSELLKFSVQGPLSDPTWHLARFPDVSSLFKKKNESVPEE